MVLRFGWSGRVWGPAEQHSAVAPISKCSGASISTTNAQRHHHMRTEARHKGPVGRPERTKSHGSRYGEATF